MRLRSFSFFLALALPVLPAAASASPPAGSLFISPEAMDPKSPTFEKDLKKKSRSVLEKTGEKWHVFVVAYLRKAPGAPDMNLVFYETQKGKREVVNAFPLQTQP